MEISLSDFVKKAGPAAIGLYLLGAVFGKGIESQDRIMSAFGMMQESTPYVAVKKNIGEDDPRKGVGFFINGKPFLPYTKNQKHNYTIGRDIVFHYKFANPAYVEKAIIKIDGKVYRQLSDKGASGAVVYWSEYTGAKKIEFEVKYKNNDTRTIDVLLEPSGK